MYTIYNEDVWSMWKDNWNWRPQHQGLSGKSQLYPFPPVTLENSLESSALVVRVKESSSSGGRDESHLNSLPPMV